MEYSLVYISSTFPLLLDALYSTLDKESVDAAQKRFSYIQRHDNNV